ncbi:MAG: hypothetical protein LUC44_08575 [Prevotellaceae bacterium]|nr:hypothetical protein [Prevotellaceae bacterium]
MFEGWHPNCFCICTPILATEEQMMADMDAALSGDEGYEPGYEQIEDYPEGFRTFVDENKEYIEDALERGTAPYFVEDNLQTVRAAMGRHAGREGDGEAR